METLSLDAVVDEAVLKVRTQLFDRGIRTLSGLGSAFRRADFNGNKKLDPEELEEALSFCGVFLTKPELTAVARKFDRSGDGSVSYDELLRGIKGGLNERRRAMVEKAFTRLDKDRSGVVTIDDLRGVYNTSKHPDVIAGRMTPEEVLLTFLESFEGLVGDRDGRVTLTEFTDYYTDVSASIPNDDFFIAMMESCWMINESEPSKAAKEKVRKWAVVLQDKIRQRCKAGESESVKLRQTFQHFDTDESGAVTIDEFGRAMERLGIPLERKDTSMFFDLFDPDGSGTITYSEFVDYVYAVTD